MSTTIRRGRCRDGKTVKLVTISCETKNTCKRWKCGLIQKRVLIDGPSETSSASNLVSDLFSIPPQTHILQFMILPLRSLDETRSLSRFIATRNIHSIFSKGTESQPWCFSNPLLEAGGGESPKGFASDPDGVEEALSTPSDGRRFVDELNSSKSFFVSLPTSSVFIGSTAATSSFSSIKF